jgi:hypothetical protein
MKFDRVGPGYQVDMTKWLVIIAGFQPDIRRTTHEGNIVEKLCTGEKVHRAIERPANQLD